MKTTKAEQAEAIERLREYVRPGTRVYTILRHVSKSGMTRVVDCKVAMPDSSIAHIGYNVAQAMGYTWDDKREGMRVGGCGMDMGSHVVYGLGVVLFGCGKDTQALDYHTGRNGASEAENDGGYLLEHSWL